MSQRSWDLLWLLVALVAIVVGVTVAARRMPTQLRPCPDAGQP